MKNKIDIPTWEQLPEETKVIWRKKGSDELMAFVQDSLKVKDMNKARREFDAMSKALRELWDDRGKQSYYSDGNKSKSINYDSILSVEFLESGQCVSQKSTTRTVGGAIVGGVISGGVGAIVGGLSGGTKERRKISAIQVKVLLRDIANPILLITCFEALSKPPYSDEVKLFMEPAIQIKDLLSIVIDKVDARSKPVNISSNASQPASGISVADELAKLMVLKEQGVISESEFNSQKNKILG